MISSLISKLAGGHQVPAPRRGGSQRPGELPGKKRERPMPQGTERWEHGFRAALLVAHTRSCCAHCADGEVRSSRTQPGVSGDPAVLACNAGLSLPDRSLQKFWASLIMDNPPKNEAHQEQTEDPLHGSAWKVTRAAICVRGPHGKAFLPQSMF